MKVKLLREKPASFQAPGHKTAPLTQALPFYRCDVGRLVHRIRSGGVHIIEGKYTHTHFRFWCGNIGFSRGPKRPSVTLFAEAPYGAIFCATCEGKAIGAGCDGAREINGRHVLFSPRT